ncbi:DNA topoisomerase [Pueribacillus sp. YX66]|uniref:DNA topoisomerase n=1 Tax=Pueribacillus sp. YX66 TaxID=3229242 RepID=UPI00358D6323
MGTTLFIAEKRDMAISIAKALSPSNDMKKGFIVGKNNMIFTWAIGHLLELDPSEKPSEKWSLETLPIIPKMFNLKPIPNKSSQLQIIKKLATDANVIINACDAGREGELIFYYIAKYLNLTKRPIKRLWTSSLQPSGIQTTYKKLKDWNEFEGLRVAAITRSRSDWIIGINATRAFTAKSGTLLKIGRVVTPTLALIYKRHMERETFKKEPYFPITATFKQGNATYIGKWQGDMIKERQLSEKIKSEILNQNGEIIEMEEKNEYEPVPLLFNLTDLTNLANQRFGFKAKQTLKLAQSLYETHKCITYPRTSNRYITENEVPLMLKSHQALKGQFTQYVKNGMNPSLVHTRNKRICNPAKVDDHHALLPEPVIPSNLSTDEEKIYHLILERFFMQFYSAAQYQSLTIHTNCAGHLFLSKYKNLIEEGWRTISEKEDKHDSNELKWTPSSRQLFYKFKVH